MENNTQDQDNKPGLLTKMPLATKICIWALITAIIFYMLGCSNSSYQPAKSVPNNSDSVIQLGNLGPTVIPINGHQYIVYEGFHGGCAMLHDEECNNIKHKTIK